MVQTEKKRLSLTEYLEIEQSGEERYEFHEGEIFAMAGGTISHGRVCGNIYGALREATKATGKCEAFTSEIKVEVKPRGKYVYPDAGLACPKLKESQHLKGAITNPKLIVEVVSETSGNYDRGAKLKYYFSLPSLQEYLIIDQDRPIITVFRRRGDLMKMDVYSGLTETFKLESIDYDLSLTDVYENVELLPLEDE